MVNQYFSRILNMGVRKGEKIRFLVAEIHSPWTMTELKLYEIC